MISSVYTFMERAAKQLGIPEEVLAQLKLADNEHVFDITLDSGKSYKAYRVQHNNKRGPYKGGIRYHDAVDLEEVRTLATLMSLKTAAVNIPMGGGKGGVAVNPRELSEPELEELSRKYVQALHPHIGPHTDIPAPDVHTNAQIIDFMVDEYAKITGDKTKASFTGKSIEGGGSQGRDAATGRGGVLALTELLGLENQTGRSITFALQGFGNVGSFFGTVAQALNPEWKLVAASDSEAAVYRKDGLNAKELQEFKYGRGRFNDFKSEGVEVITNDELLGLEVDVLVLAGFENTVTEENMKTIQADYIVEMANGPITDTAYDYLVHKEKTILPDIIANAGGVIVSYLEWLQNINDEKWSEETVNAKLSEYIRTSVKEIYDYAAKHQVSLNDAAFAVAVKRLVESS